MNITIAGIDPALNNTGIVIGTLDIDTMKYELVRSHLIVTEKAKNKTVRRNSDDLRRAFEISAGMMLMLHGVDVVFVEVPQGTRSARGAMSNGIVLGCLTTINKPLFQVAPTETKKYTIGSKTATKEEMINWATSRFPNLPWIKGRGEAKYSPRNEHVADACGIVESGLRLVEFRDFLAMYKKIHQS